MKVKGIKKASGKTANYGACSDFRTDIFLNLRDGSVWAAEVFGDNSWIQYHDDMVVFICSTKQHITMAEIKTAIEQKMYELYRWGDGETARLAKAIEV